MTSKQVPIPVERIERTILLLRGQKVILDADLGRLYGVSTKRLNEQIRRNQARFPKDFMFQLTREEKSEVVANCDHLSSLKFSPALPLAFTEHGAIMAATVLNSPEAIQMSVFVVRAFIKMREALISRSELERRLLRIENVLLAHDESIRELYDQIRPLLLPPPEGPRKKIGFEVKESAGRYGKDGKRK